MHEPHDHSLQVKFYVELHTGIVMSIKINQLQSIINPIWTISSCFVYIWKIFQTLIGERSWDKYSHIYVIFLHSESLFAYSKKPLHDWLIASCNIYQCVLHITMLISALQMEVWTFIFQWPALSRNITEIGQRSRSPKLWTRHDTILTSKHTFFRAHFLT